MTPSRRTLLGGLAGATLARGCVPVPALAEGPDAELIRLCAEYQRRRNVVRRMDDHADVYTDEEAEEAGLAMLRALEELSDVSATTPAGLRAKAGALRTVLEYDVPVSIGDTVEECADRHEWLAFTLARDVLAMGA